MIWCLEHVRQVWPWSQICGEGGPLNSVLIHRSCQIYHCVFDEPGILHLIHGSLSGSVPLPLNVLTILVCVGLPVKVCPCVGLSRIPMGSRAADSGVRLSLCFG